MALKPVPILGFGAVLLLLLNLILSAASFDYLQSLEGSQKGKTVKGVYKLKQYLKQFGYLHYENHAAHANDDEFDELLEAAVKIFQLNYHLNVTGTLDSETVKHMMKPRCGVPDIINGQTRMRSGKQKKHQGRGLHSLHTVSRYSFFNGNPPPRWPESKLHLTYAFISDDSPVDAHTLRGLISRAFNKWAAVSQFTFAEAKDGSHADLKIGFRSMDGPRNILGLSYQPTVGLFLYDADEKWSTNPVSGQYDLESIAIHEIGHLLGLGHSGIREAIMYPSIGSGVKKLNLKDDDIQGISALYNV